jgi:hypothetical protein
VVEIVTLLKVPHQTMLPVVVASQIAKYVHVDVPPVQAAKFADAVLTPTDGVTPVVAAVQFATKSSLA